MLGKSSLLKARKQFKSILGQVMVIVIVIVRGRRSHPMEVGIALVIDSNRHSPVLWTRK